MAATGIDLITVLQLFFATSVFGYSLKPNHCEFPTDTPSADCGYYGIQELECVRIGCCWKPCYNCAQTTLWCIKSKDMHREECAQKPERKKDCGYNGIQREECLRKRCCWTPSDIPNDAWCYYESTSAVPPTVLYESESPSSQNDLDYFIDESGSGENGDDENSGNSYDSMEENNLDELEKELHDLAYN